MLINSLIVFALTLILTKSQIMAGKREFVELRYEAAKQDGHYPSWLHTWFYKMWTCPMCSGFWVAIPVSLFYPIHGIVPDVLIVFSINWLLHCVESLMFFGGEILENIDKAELVNESSKAVKKIECYYDRMESDRWKNNI